MGSGRSYPEKSRQFKKKKKKKKKGGGGGGSLPRKITRRLKKERKKGGTGEGVYPEKLHVLHCHIKLASPLTVHVLV